MDPLSIKKPCKNCPFRSDIQAYLTKDRIDLMERELIKEQKSFSCHKTVNYKKKFEGQITNKSKHCAGAAILLLKNGTPNQMMQVASRLGWSSLDDYEMDSPVFNTFKEMKDAQA